MARPLATSFLPRLGLACALGIAACSTTPQAASRNPLRVAPPTREPPPLESSPSFAALRDAAALGEAGAADAAARAEIAATPPYDLAADLTARGVDAKRRLGAGAATAVVGDVFLLAGPRSFGGFASSRSLTARALSAFYNDRFGRRPGEAITVYLFGDAQSYSAFCKAAIHEECISIYGFYWPSERWMVMNAGLGLGTLTHELVHPLVEADFPDAPTWLNEGIASIFEAPTFPKPGEIHGVKNWRLPRLQAALGGRSTRAKAMPRTLFGMADDVFRDDDEALHYALARYFCQWLDERGELWPFYRAYRDERRADPTGAATFKRVVGTTPEEAEAPFLAWLSRL
ncbi:MAG TPA: hypothetical protein PK141_00915 [Polyangiaceae bacterium]|nr:hypothetical protein [Polyangiaceae bacterium]